MDETKENRKKKHGADNEEEERGYIRWNIEMEQALADVLRDQRHLGNKGNGGWKKCATRTAASILSARFHRDITADNIRNRIKTWKKYYVVVNDILSQRGIKWDDTKKMISIDEESVWEEYAELHKDVRPFRWKVIPNWADIEDLCGKDRTSGEEAKTAPDANEISQESTDVNHVSATQDIDDAHYKEDTLASPPNFRRKRGKSSCSSFVPPKKKGTSKYTLAVAVAKMVTSLEDFLQSTTQKLDAVEVYNVINKVEDLGEEAELKACMWFIEHEKQFLMLKALPSEKKKSFILMVLSKAS